jgi:hypothetical protein
MLDAVVMGGSRSPVPLDHFPLSIPPLLSWEILSSELPRNRLVGDFAVVASV